MARYGYSGDKQYRPITAWGYVGYTILFFIPIIGFIFLIIFTFHNGNINRRSFARSYWCFALIAILVYAVSFAGIVWLMKDRQGWPVSLLNGINGIRYKIIDILTNVDIATPTPGASILQTEPPTQSSTRIQPLTNKETLAGVSQDLTNVPSSSSTVSPDTLGVTPSFKEMMDSTETFVDDYVTFILKYKNSSNDLGMMVEYTSFSLKYAETMKKIEAYDDQEMSRADRAYYIEVMARINKRLLDAY